MPQFGDCSILEALTTNISYGIVIIELAGFVVHVPRASHGNFTTIEDNEILL